MSALVHCLFLSLTTMVKICVLTCMLEFGAFFAIDSWSRLCLSPDILKKATMDAL